MNLQGHEREQLAKALLSAFPNRSKLQEFVSFRLEENLNEIANDGNLRSVVLDLIHWAEGEGYTRKLIAAAQEYVPDNPLLKTTAPGLLASIDNRQAKPPVGAMSSEVPGSLSIPPLPAFHLRREPLLQLIADKLQLWGNHALGVPLVIYGTGGIGKTTLAVEFARHPRTAKYFDKMVLWADLRGEPDPLAILVRWLRELGETEFTPTDVEGARVRVRMLLHERRALLVLDNVSKADQVEQLRVGGPHCNMLVTARRPVVAEFCNARRFDVPPLAPGEALSLLEGLLDRPLRPQEREDAAELAELVGYLPLALRLAAIRIERRDTWRMLLDALNQEIARLEAFDSVGFPVGQEKTIRAFLNVHLKSLRASDGDAWASLLRLAPLAHGVRLTPALAGTVWRCDEMRAKQVLEHLWTESLIAEAGVVDGVGGDQPAWSIHELMHSHIQFLFGAPRPEGLGSTLAQGHGDLVDSYRERSLDGRWSGLPDDGYITQMLGWHLERAGRGEDLHVLFAEERNSSNAWYTVCRERGQLRHYAHELQRAWRLADSAAAKDLDGRQLGLACRYCLVDASLVSLEQGFPPAAMLRLVQEGRWSPARGIDYALAARSEGIRGRALSGLAGLVPEDLLSYVSDEGQKLHDPRDRAEVWIELARNRRNPFREQAADAAWREIDRIRPVVVRGDLFHRLAHATYGGMRRKAIASACDVLEIKRPSRANDESDTLRRISDHLRERLGPRYRRERFPHAERWIQQMPPEDLEARLTAPVPIGDSDALLRLRIACVPYLPGRSPREQALPLLEQAFDRLSGTDHLVAAVRVLSGCLTSPIPRPILTKARSTSRSVDQCQILSFLLPRVEPNQRESVANAIAHSAHRVMDNDIRAQVLHRAIPLVSPRLRVKVWNAARSMRDRDASAFALLSLARVYQSPAREELQRMARRKISGYQDVDLWFKWQLQARMSREAEAEADRETTNSLTELVSGEATALLACLHKLAILGRELCAEDLIGLVPSVSRYGGGPAVAELYRAAENVGRWWP